MSPLLVMLVTPVAAGLILALVSSHRVGSRINTAASLVTFLAGAALLVERPAPNVLLFIDDFNVFFVVLTAFVALTTSVFSASYIDHEIETGRITPTHLRFYHAMYQALSFFMLLALTANNIGVMWVAIEGATLTTVLMVSLYRTREAIEASWKYFMLGSVGIALALFGTILVYSAAEPIVGSGLEAMAWLRLVEEARFFNPYALNVAFVFLLVGYGTKVGLAPLHAWLPDAHAEGPTPISAVLSGLLLNVALYALLRFKMMLAANADAVAPGPLMVAMGLASLFLAGLMLYRRQDIKRLFAYSSIEHMGIITFAFGMGGPLANFAALLHMVMHSLTKSAIFFAVGHVVQVSGTQRMADIRGLTASHPWLGWALVAGVLAIAGLPPFGVFMSEFLILTTTIARQPLLAIPLVAGLLVAFAALLRRLQGLAFGAPSVPAGAVKASLVPLYAHLGLVLIAGLYLPPPLVAWFENVARLLGEIMTPDTLSPSLLQTLARFRAVETHRPWPRHEVGMAAWAGLVEHLQTADWSLVGLWATKPPPGAEATVAERAGEVHMALRDEVSGEIAVVSLACPDGRFPTVSAVRPGAIRLERAIRDLFGIEAVGLDDTRAWLDHGRWPVRRPLSSNAAPRPGEPVEAASYEFLAAEGDGVALHQVPVGPVHAGIIEPGHFRFTCLGETVVRLEERLGYVHKGVESLMEGRTAAEAARLAARVSGDSTVAYGIAFARAVEAALGVEAPPRATWLRALMAEIERIANHLGDIGAVCNDVAFAFLHAHLAVWRERVLQASDACFGHRLMMDRVVPGGVAADLSADGRRTLGSLLSELRSAFRELVRIYDDKPSLSDRVVGTGGVTTTLVHRFGAGGFVGRAALRGQDARTSPAYPPYDDLEFDVPVLGEGDVNARVWVRIREVQASFGLMEQILLRLPEGPIRLELPVAPPGGTAEGMALVEGFRGEILVWVRLGSDGRVLRCHPRDPSWFQWPLLEAAIEDNIIADFPVCNKSFNCSYSGHDL